MSIATPVAVHPIKIGSAPLIAPTAVFSGERVFITIPITYRQSRIVFLGDELIRADILQERVRQ